MRSRTLGMALFAVAVGVTCGVLRCGRGTSREPNDPQSVAVAFRTAAAPDRPRAPDPSRRVELSKNPRGDALSDLQAEFARALLRKLPELRVAAEGSDDRVGDTEDAGAPIDASVPTAHRDALLEAAPVRKLTAEDAEPSQVLTDIARAWAKAPRDETWTREMDGHLRQSIRDLEVDANARDVDCRSRYCRVEVELRDQDAAEQLLEYAARPDEKLYVEAFPDPAQGVGAVVYLSRGKR